MQGIKKLIGALALSLSAMSFAPAGLAGDAATDYPSGPVKIVVPVQPGSQSDIFARLWGDMLQNRLGQPVVVENLPGAGGIIGAKAVAGSEPDGLTLLYGSTSPIVIAPQLSDPPAYDTTADFEPFMIALKGQAVIAVKPSLPIQSAEDLIKYAKEHPGELNYGSHGVGSFSHVATELLMDATGIEMQHIPYNGGGPLAAGFLAGEVDIVLFDVLSLLPHAKSGDARAVAQVGESRSPLFPDVPTVGETVAPGLTANYYFGLMAPKGTPQEILEKLNREVTEILKTAEMQAEAKKASMVVPGGTVDEARAEVRRDWQVWGKIIRDNKISAQ
ncbi:hypothetical protein FQZ97_478120 [compost metagenome]